MKKKHLVSQTAQLLRDIGARKLVPAQKQSFTISDDLGRSKVFTFKSEDKSVLYTVEDIECIVDACMDVMEEAMKRGDPINIRGFGTLGLRYKEERFVVDFETGEKTVRVAPRYVPKFTFGSRLRMAAQTYTTKVEDGEISFPTEEELDFEY